MIACVLADSFAPEIPGSCALAADADVAASNILTGKGDVMTNLRESSFLPQSIFRGFIILLATLVHTRTVSGLQSGLAKFAANRSLEAAGKKGAILTDMFLTPVIL